MNKSVDFVKLFRKVMKVGACQLLVAILSTGLSLAVPATAQKMLDRKITIHVKNQKINVVLSDITRLSGVQFMYSPELIQSGRTVSLSVRNKRLEAVLQELLLPLNIDYEVSERQILLRRKTVPGQGHTIPLRPEEADPGIILPETYIVKGKVTDEQGEGLPGVSILIKGNQQGTITDSEGHFELDVQNGNAILVFSFVGYVSHETAVNFRTTLQIRLQIDEKSLEEVVVVGYGKQAMSTVTSSISKLDNKVLENIPYSNAASALQGTISGIRVQTTTGQPGAAPRIIIRGGTSINDPNSAAPLYIVDGVIRPNMNDLNPDDIASLQVLKDAASTAIYGARGSNGVVLITTKSGKSGKLQISYSPTISISNLDRQYDLVKARDYIRFFRLGVVATARKIPARMSLLTAPNPGGTGNDLTNSTAYTTQYLTSENEHKLEQGWESMPDPLDPSKTIIFQGVDWQDLLFRTGIAQNHNLTMSGGTDKATFSLGAGYHTNTGIAIGTDYRRVSLNMNGELQLRDNLNVFGRMMYSNSGTNGGAWPWDRSHAAPPTMKHRFEDGSLAPGDYFPSPVYRVSRQDIRNNDTKLTIAMGGNWNILPGLIFSPQLSLYQATTDNRSFQKSYFNLPTQFVDSRVANGSYSKYLQKQADAVLSYSKVIGNGHSLDITSGFSYWARESANLTARGQGASTDLIPTLNASATPVAVSSSESYQMLLGYFGRINYAYRQKYLVSLSGRYDGASNLGESNKWGFFPGVSVGWNLHHEEFWKALRADLLRLKLRGSYGVNGNISALGDYQAQGQYSVGSLYASQSAIRNTVLPNQNLQWERSKTLDIGIDGDLFNNRIGFRFDYFTRITDNLLTNLALPAETGFSSILTNWGSLQNKGTEVELTFNIFPAKSLLQWNISANAAKVLNKIRELPYNGNENNRIGGINIWDPVKKDYIWAGGLQEGQTIGDLFAFRQVGIYATDEEAANGPVDMMVVGNDKTKYGGDVNWFDADQNGIIDQRDRTYMGNIYPKWTGGISNFLSYKNLDIALRMDYITGHVKYNWSRALMLAQYGAYGGITSEVLRSWQEQGDITDIPRYYWADQQTQRNIARLGDTSIDGGNSIFYESGNFLAIREVTLGYNIPKHFIDKAGISRLRLYFSGQNLHYFTRYKGLNPEDGGMDMGGYPIPRNLIIGAQISL